MQNPDFYSVSMAQVGAFKTLAQKYEYIPAHPTFPKNETPETVRGFEGRLFNWRTKLEHHIRMSELNKASEGSSQRAKTVTLFGKKISFKEREIQN